jgi:hypothetical protein
MDLRLIAGTVVTRTLGRLDRYRDRSEDRALGEHEQEQHERGSCGQGTARLHSVDRRSDELQVFGPPRDGQTEYCASAQVRLGISELRGLGQMTYFVSGD